MASTKADPAKTRIGWIGTGVMGRWMCQHLMTKGYKATVYNRSKSKAQPLLEQGAASDTKPPITRRPSGPRGQREKVIGRPGSNPGNKPRGGVRVL